IPLAVARQDEARVGGPVQGDEVEPAAAGHVGQGVVTGHTPVSGDQGEVEVGVRREGPVGVLGQDHEVGAEDGGTAPADEDVEATVAGHVADRCHAVELGRPPDQNVLPGADRAVGPAGQYGNHPV